MKNIKSQSISATLPTLGTHEINFYKESAEVLEFLGEKELNRLSRINHLGIASAVFTGVNHSRLEYTLLQCAIISLLPKFNSGAEEFAIGGKVQLAGLDYKVSSGAELLKCWSLLGNSGHTQYTYGVERAILTYARETPEFKSFLLKQIRQQNLKQYCTNVVDDYQDNNIHWLLAILRISQIEPRKRNKQRFISYLQHLLLPLNQLNFQNYSDKCKIFKLRKIFSQIRLLSIVTLDSYYSHQPIRYQISPIIMDIRNLLSQDDSRFIKLLLETASWLADEIYMHPQAVAIMCSYEQACIKKIRQRDFSSSEKFQEQMRNIMANGFGLPKNDSICHFLRLTLPLKRFHSFQNKDIHSIRNELRQYVATPKHTDVYIMKNPFSSYLYCDFLFDRNKSSLSDISNLCSNIYLWLEQIFNHQVEVFLSSIPVNGFDTNKFKKLRINRLQREVKLAKSMIFLLFNSTLKHLLPNDMRGVISEFIPNEQFSTPLLLKFKFITGAEYNEITPKLKQIVEDNPNNLCEDRLQDLKALSKAVLSSRASLLIVCAEKFIVKDKNGSCIKEWDGVFLEIFSLKTRLVIVEAKNKRISTQNENEAFKQLEETQRLIRQKQSCKTNRKRIKSLGAKLTISLN